MRFCKNCNTEYETGKFCKKCGGELVEKVEETLVCPNCGKTLDPGTKFCPECGTKVLLEKLQCSACGFELTPGAKFCPECGTKVGSENKDEKKEASQTNHTSVLLDVTLTFAEKNKKKIISALESYGFSYENAEGIVECVPFTIKESIPEEEALSIKVTLEDLGAEVELEYAGAEEQFIQVILESLGSSKLDVMNKLQEVCKYNIKRSKFLVERIPTVIKEACTKYEADFIKNEFESIGCEIEFENIHLVDLGLPSGLLWADRNVGAATPEDFGNYFTWGDVNPSPEKGYIEETKCRRIDVFRLKEKGITDSEYDLTASYDAASKNWGNKWRMPTCNEFTELLVECNKERKFIDGQEGYMFTRNGNSIFLPLEDCCDDNYWTSSETMGGDDGDAYSYMFGSRNDFPYGSSYNKAYSIRPVFRKACKRK